MDSGPWYGSVGVDLAQYLNVKQETKPVTEEDKYFYIPVKGENKTIKIDLWGLADI